MDNFLLVNNQNLETLKELVCITFGRTMSEGPWVSQVTSIAQDPAKDEIVITLDTSRVYIYDSDICRWYPLSPEEIYTSEVRILQSGISSYDFFTHNLFGECFEYRNHIFCLKSNLPEDYPKP